MMDRNDINWSIEGVNPDIAKMTNSEMTQYLIHAAGIGESARLSYAAGYFESTLLTLMAQFPEVRKEIEWRVNYKMNQMKEAV